MLSQLTLGCLLASVTLIAAPTPAGTAETDVTSADAVRPILIGTPVPDGPVKTQAGRDTTLGELRAGQPSVLVFYRGHW
jgi:hypothetical protein